MSIKYLFDDVILPTKELDRFLKSTYKYYAQYFYIDPMGGMFSGDDGFVILAYGNDKEKLAEYCETLGFKPSKNEIDGGYFIKEMEE